MRLVAQPDPKEALFRTYCAHANFGHCKQGRPVYWERTGLCAKWLPTLLKVQGRWVVVNVCTRPAVVGRCRLLLAAACWC